MIELYFSGNEDFEKNGNLTLMPLSCTIDAELNGAWSLSLKHNLDSEGRYKYIQAGCVLKVPSFNGLQLFRISNIERTLEYIQVSADPIFIDAMNDVFLLDVRPTGVNGQTALNQIFAGTKYSGKSDIVKTAKAYYVQKNGIEAINGSDENAFTQRWGGQIIYNNREVIINERAGGDYGVTVQYGKNITGISETISRDQIVTRIVPKAYNGYMLDGDKPWVDSPIIDKYPIVYTKIMEFDDVKLQEDAGEGETGYASLTALQAELKRRCTLLFRQQQVDRELVELNIDMLILESTEEYKNFKILEKISLGDTVKCKHSVLDIDVNTQVVGITFDCLKKRVENVVLGNYQPKYFNETTKITNSISGSIRADGSLVAEKLQGVINGLDAYFRIQNTIAQRQEARAILFEDLDPDSDLYGALAIGTKGIEIADMRTADGRGWDWKTAITAHGVIAEELIGEAISGIELIADKARIGKFVFDSSQEGGGFYGDYGNWRVFFQPAYQNDNGVNQTWVLSTQYKEGNDYKGTFILYADGRQEHCEGSDYYHEGTSIRSGSRDGTSHNVIEMKSGGELNIGEDNLKIKLAKFIFEIASWRFEDDTEEKNRDTICSAGDLVIAAGNDGNRELNLDGTRLRVRCPASFHKDVNIGANLNCYSNSYFSYVIQARRGISGYEGPLDLFGEGYIHANDEFRLNFKASSGTIPLVVGTNGQITTATSSKRYKENITDKLDEDLDPKKLYDLPVVQYNYRYEYKDLELVEGTQIGITAEDVEKYFPNALIKNENGEAESWQDRIIIPALIKLAQEQHKEIENLKARLTRLEELIKE